MAQKPQILSAKHYPYILKSAHMRDMRNYFVLGLGSNLAKAHSNSINVLENVFRFFASHTSIRICRTSPIWRNPAFGYKKQNDFYNAIMLCESSLNVLEVYRLIFYVERRFGRGRKRTFKNAPRIIDIDLIFFNKLRLKRDYLHIPHRFCFERPSVFVPLSFIETFWR